MDKEPGAPDSPAGEPNPTDGGSLGAAVAFLTLGLRMAAALVVCGGLGYLVDDWLGTSPAFVLVGVALGVLAAVGQAVITVRRYL
ncbi:MAG: AtpZ/AtpI family protein [Acidimicrobiales bacterium]|nr:AtpZ/AtpI family protein [Acidimicrobiales bacterium]